MATQHTAQPSKGQRRIFQPGEWPTKKTVDIGRNGVSVSADPLGGIYQISSKIHNPAYAMMIAAPWPQFSQKDRQDPLVVREYRKHMEKRLARKQRGLGLRLGVENDAVLITHINDSRGGQVQIKYQDRQKTLFVQTVLKVQDDGRIIQAHQVTNTGSQTREVPIHLDLSFAVSRASYGQLTDQGEVPMPAATNEVIIYRDDGNHTSVASIENHSLGARLTAHVLFRNRTTNTQIKADTRLFPPWGRDYSPPSRLLDHEAHNAHTQIVQITGGATLAFTCVLTPEDIMSVDDSMPDLLDEALLVHGADFDEGQALERHLSTLTAGSDAGKGEEELHAIQSTIVFANTNYIIGCCSLPVNTPTASSWAVIPDHVALPLGWPRDNYWQLRLLSRLCVNGWDILFPSGRGHLVHTAVDYYTESMAILRGHLMWLFTVATVEAQAADGKTAYFWRRSYLINGRPKDGTVYQLDTQLYPFLQLCEFDEYHGKGAHQPAVIAVVKSMMSTSTFSSNLLDLLSRQDVQTGLFKTDETPADDDSSDYPFHLSSNILAWYTMRRLAQLLRRMPCATQSPFDPRHLDHVADTIFQGIGQYLVCKCEDGSGELMFAYSLDSTKAADNPARHRRYHDGNDMPLLFAVEWGFLDESGNEDAAPRNPPAWRTIWEKTLDWAFTPDPNWTVDAETRRRTPGLNSGYAGNGKEPFHGLGSDHSEGAWILGFFQEWKYAQLVGDARREATAWEKIKGSMQWDGTFSEAVDVYDGSCTSKTWFSWPGAMIAENLVANGVVRTKA